MKNYFKEERIPFFSMNIMLFGWLGNACGATILLMREWLCESSVVVCIMSSLSTGKYSETVKVIKQVIKRKSRFKPVEALLLH